MTTLTLIPDAADVRAVQRALASLAQAAERLPQVRERLVDLFRHPSQLVRIYADGGAAPGGAGQVRVRFELSDPLAELAAAVRAGQFDA